MSGSMKGFLQIKEYYSSNFPIINISQEWSLLKMWKIVLVILI